MTPFLYLEFYDVPRCIALPYRERLFLLQSAFDELLDDYPTSYSVYILPESVEGSVRKGSWELLGDTKVTCIGHIQIKDVVFDPTKRKELDASILDRFLAGCR
ncbi:MAG TPA: hypothetical protein VKZ53_19250 [Candidatus Angelobacter sp.]|nr:hypothetical protein [Candidatus Angelobacter sp.]